MKPKFSREEQIRWRNSILMPGDAGSYPQYDAESPAESPEQLESFSELEAFLREEGLSIRNEAVEPDVKGLVRATLKRANQKTYPQTDVNQTIAYISQMLAPVCGRHFANQTIRLAADGLLEDESVHLDSERWEKFVLKLSSILSSICGASVGTAAGHISRLAEAEAA